MKAYSFARILALEYPTLNLLGYPDIWNGVQLCVNLSEHFYSPQLAKALTDRGIEWLYCPVSEEAGADWLEALAVALPKMYLAYRAGKKQIVHCDLGDNRSRTFIEALYYALERKQFQDPYRDAENHLVYNCKEGHLPDVAELERRIRAMLGVFPAWSLLEEADMRRILLSPSPEWTYRTRPVRRRATVTESRQEELTHF